MRGTVAKPHEPVGFESRKPFTHAGWTATTAQFFPLLFAWSSPAPLSEIRDHAISAARQLYNPAGGAIAPAARINRIDIQQSCQVNGRSPANSKNMHLLAAKHGPDMQQVFQNRVI